MRAIFPNYSIQILIAFIILCSEICSFCTKSIFYIATLSNQKKQKQNKKKPSKGQVSMSASI